MLTPYSAFSALDRMFDDVMGAGLGAAKSARTFEPDVDVRTNERELIFMCDLPGVKRDDVEITLDNRILTIQGARNFDAKEDEHVMLGRSYGSFRRAFELPDTINEEGLEANLADGVLTVRVPKRAKPEPKKITIGSTSPAPVNK